MSDTDILRSPLHDEHLARGATMGVACGWEVPLRFGTAESETAETHRRAGVFDRTPVGRIRIRGDGALDLLERCCEGDVAHQEDDTAIAVSLRSKPGRLQFPHDCYREARRPPGNCNRPGLFGLLRLEDSWLLLTPPEQRQAAMELLEAEAASAGAKVDDQTCKTAMLAVVGPLAPGILDAVLPMKVSDLAAGQVRTGSLLLARYIAVCGQVGGLWSLEVIVPNLLAGKAWRFIIAKAGANCVPPAGLEAWQAIAR